MITTHRILVILLSFIISCPIIHAQKPIEPESLRLIHLENAEATATAAMIKQLFDVTVGADDRTNSILVRAEPELLLQIEAVLRELDRPTKSTPGKANSLSTKLANTTELKTRYEQAERDAATQAQRLRQQMGKGSGQDFDIKKLREDLRALVARAFEARQELHQAELAALQTRVTQIQKAISQRTNVKDQMIDRRVEDLLNPDLNWDAPSITNQPASTQPSPASRSSEETHVPGFPKTSAADGRPAKSQPVVGIPLSDAVRAFNNKYVSHPVGKDQPPLTDDEVVAALRWTVGRNDSANSKKPASPFETVVQTRSLPQDMHLEATVETEQPDKSKLWHWTVRIVDKRPDGRDAVEIIREQFIRWLPVKPVALNHKADSQADPNDRNSRPLAAAIESFNIQHRGHPIGKDQPPLTVDEVIAAIRNWNTKRNEADVTNIEFDALQAIADSGRLPGSAEFEVLTSFQPNSYFEVDAWSVRIKMPRTSKPGWTYAFTIRDRWIDSRLLDEREIAWGAVASNGLQAGVLLHPRNEQYAVGQRIQPQFFFRNAGQQNYSVAFPRIMTSSYYDNLQVVGDAGQPIRIEKDPGPGGPVGWIEMPLPPDSVHEIAGRTIVIGQPQSGTSDETAILAEPGQSCRIRFTVPNFEDPKGKPLETGQVRFTVSR